MVTAIIAIIGFALLALYAFFIWRANKGAHIDQENVAPWMLALAVAVFVYHAIFLVVALSTQHFLWFSLLLGLSLVSWFYFGYSYLYRKLTAKDGLIHFASAGGMALAMLLFFVFNLI